MTHVIQDKGPDEAMIKNKIQIKRTHEEDKEILLKELSNDFFTSAVVLRWLEFLLERIQRPNITKVLEYYQNLGWISENVRLLLLKFLRGEIQDVYSYEPPFEQEDPTGGFETIDNINIESFESTPLGQDQIADWKLPAEDHLRSLLFIYKLKGESIDKDQFFLLETELNQFKTGSS